ncbi:MAG TPA: CBS domain-containing protein [Patescibacteria group bacterium]|nr:CBS domain-containing protein [Patescibacteria group bacterium]
MIVSEIMSRDIITVSPDTSYRDLCKRIFTSHVHTLPVVDSKNRLVGMVTRKDILERIYPKYQDVLEFLETPQDFEAMEARIKDMAPLHARDIMATTVIFARESTLVMRALSRMIVRHVDQLPILNDDDEVVGMVTKGDIFYSLFRKHLAGPLKSPHKKHKKPKRRTRS